MFARYLSYSLRKQLIICLKRLITVKRMQSVVNIHMINY